MNLQNILSDIEQVDPEVYERLSSRRNLFRVGRKVAAAAVPLAFGASLKQAYGQATSGIVDILNFALTLEYLEDTFYKAGLAAPNLIPAAQRLIFQQISKHESQHVDFLRSAIAGAGGTPVAAPRVDPTAGGTFRDVLTNYQTFLLVSQALEDTGVRAYKGQAGNLVGNDAVLTAALQIHSVEARHAAEVRRLRNVKPWVTATDTVPAAVYAGEDVVTQAGVNINTVAAGISATAAAEAFDEGLTREQVLAIARPFIIG